MVVMFGMMMFVSKMSVSSAAAAAVAALCLNPASQSSIDPEELKQMQKQIGDPMKALKEGFKEVK